MLVVATAVVGGVGACAQVAGLPDYSNGASPDTNPAPKPKDAGHDSTAASGDDTDAAEASDDDAGPSDDGADGASDGDAETDADGSMNESDGAPEAGGDAGDSGAGSDGGDGGAPDAGDGGSCFFVTHSNGLGKTYTSCAPLNTFGPDEAAKACAAAGAGPCATQMIICGINDTETLECATTASSCECWTYELPNVGFAKVSALAGNLCQCPLPTDHAWH